MRTKNTMQLKAYIRNKAREMDVPPQLVMQNYLLERLLERISHSSWRGRIVIKGGMLISSLVGVDRRGTKDLDVTVRGFALTHNNVARAFGEIAAIDVGDDFEFDCTGTNHRLRLWSHKRLRRPVSVTGGAPPLTILRATGRSHAEGAGMRRNRACHTPAGTARATWSGYRSTGARSCTDSSGGRSLG